MSKRQIITFPDKILKQVSKNVAKVTSSVQDLVQDMFNLMHSHDGIGLAAPQVGENLNILVMDVTRQINEKRGVKTVSNPLCFINPQIVASDGSIIYEEGCLSCPDLLVEVKRFQFVTVKALNQEGQNVVHQLSDLEAVCLQHEIDHLKGKLLTDYISRLKRDLYKKKQLRGC